MPTNNINRRYFCKSAAVAGASLGALPLAAQSIKRPKNILFLMSDQHAPDVMGAYGDACAHTPALDGLAKSGMSMRNTYCQNPVCVPSRNSILLGRYCHSTGVIANSSRSPRDMKSFTQHLREQGYRSGCFGKLHVHGRSDLDWDDLDETGGHNYVKEKGENLILSGTLNGNKRLGAALDYPIEHTAEWLAKENSIKFMRKNRDRPWVMQCSMHKPHPSFQPPRQYWDAVDRNSLAIPEYPKDDLADCHPLLWQRMEQRILDKITREQVLDGIQGYYGNVAFCDAMFGEVLQELDRLGLRDDTLIVYTSDHGEMLYYHRLWTKFTFFEQSVRVPLILSYPELIPAGGESKALIEQVDLFPTFMNMLGFDTPDTVQGTSFLPTLTGERNTHKNIVRSEHRFGTVKSGGMVMVRMQYDGRYKLIDNGRKMKPELYDLQEDPREITNIAGNAQHRDLVANWSQELRTWGNTDVVEPVRRNNGNQG
jgi:arylsulfatase A-like enzyme